MTDALVVRPATPDDARAVADVYLAARRAAELAGTIPPGIHDDDDVRGWVATHLLPDTRVWVAEDEHRGLVGFMSLTDGWVEHLYLAPGRTGRGTGSALLDLAKADQPDGLQLWTFISNSGARRFYERHGFVAVETTDGSGNEERAPDVRYRWPEPDARRVTP